MEINTTTLEFDKTGFFSGLIADYLKKEERLEPFYSFYPEPESFEQAIQERKYNFDRELLTEVITGQNVNAEINVSEITLENINLLKRDNTYTITTGHQLCLFTGPLYFVYKIITTINLAEELKVKYPTCNFVPVFWMASEDHDFEEINHIHLFGKKIVWDPEEAVSGPVGKINTSTLSNEIEALREILGNTEQGRELYDLFHKAYLKHHNLSDAARYLVNELFGKWGLVIIDAEDKRLKEALKAVVLDDIFNQTPYHLINKTIHELSHAGYPKAQLNPREINLFYLKNNSRERIEKAEDGTYRVLQTSIAFSKEELKQEIEKYPERFSPNVSLRPLYQEIILPGIAYVGGGGELAYWLQLKAVFDHYKINFPALVLRNSLMWIDSAAAEKMIKLNLSISDLFQETAPLINQLVVAKSHAELSLEEEMDKLKTLYQEISEKAIAIDSTLKAAVEADLQRHLQALKHLEHKLLKAEKQKHETSINQVIKLREKLFPGNGLQERYDNFIPFYLKYGKAFFIALKEQFRPFSRQFLIIQENIQEPAKLS